MKFRQQTLNSTPDALQRMCRMALAIKDAAKLIDAAFFANVNGVMSAQSSDTLVQQTQRIERLVWDLESEVMSRAERMFGLEAARTIPLFSTREGIAAALERCAVLEANAA